MHVHMVGVCGTGMGSLASLFRRAGHRVSGSDLRFDPPMGDVLLKAGVECVEGYAAANLIAGIDLVVVGNVIRKDNVEAVAAEARGLRRSSMSSALREHFLERRRPLVVCGTHGKTTTSSMCAWALVEAGLEPGYFIGGVSKKPPEERGARAARHRASRGAAASPFVVEGDEYDAVYWHKEPKFFDYIGLGEDDVAIVTSIEHDHIDIYPTEDAYTAAFAALARAACRRAGCSFATRRTASRCEASREARPARVAYYALEGDDTGDVTPDLARRPGRHRPIKGGSRSTSTRGASRAGASCSRSPGTTTCGTPWRPSRRAPRVSA